MAIDFSNVSKLRITSDTTAKYHLYDIDMEDASLTVKPATRANTKFTNAQLALALPYQRQLSAKRLSAERIASFRDASKPLYARHIIVGWENIVDTNGKTVPFDQDVCLQFLNALPDQTFDDLISFCEDENNFRDTEVDEDHAKN